MNSKTFLWLIACAVGWAAGCLPVRAAGAVAFPPQMTIVVPYPPGSSNDIFARLLAARLGPALSSNVIVQNKAGASGNIGTGFVAKSPPNGTNLLVTSSSFTTGAAVEANLSYDPVADLVPVAQMAKGPLVIAVNAKSPYKSLADLLATARAHKRKVNFGSSGIGSLSQLANELLNARAQVEMTHIPYKGMSEVMNDLSGGQIDMAITSVPGVAPQVKAGLVRGLAVTSPAASPFAPGLPPAGDTVNGFSVEIWWGVFAPRSTPDAMIERLNTEILAIVGQPEMRDRFAIEGAVPGRLSAGEFSSLVRSDIEQWRRLAVERGIKAQ